MNKKTIIAIAAIVALLAVVLAIRSLRGSRERLVPLAAMPLFEQAGRFESSGNLVSAKQTYQKLVNEFPNSRAVAAWQNRIEAINVQLIFSPAITPGSIEYEIKPGDSLEKISRDHKTTAELVAKANGLANEIIYPGRKIKVWTAPFSIVVDKSQNTLILKTGEEVFKTYIVATGTNNSTPTGTFSIIEKIINPPWYKPGGGMVPAGSPENILGTRWLGIDKPGYGIHGTTDPSSLGKQATAGCVRMSNQDVEQLFAIVPKGTEVTIVN
ncbi:MAG: L,D-transpeptidase family protein [Candidatus Omnitrophica bacterium]|nr:L,D-transpeptidase family protein [Candidatus Omnitrophota bacterium]